MDSFSPWFRCRHPAAPAAVLCRHSPAFFHITCPLFDSFRPCRSPERHREEKYAEAFSPMRSQVLGPSRSTSTGVKNLVSTRFFTLRIRGAQSKSGNRSRTDSRTLHLQIFRNYIYPRLQILRNYKYSKLQLFRNAVTRPQNPPIQ